MDACARGAGAVRARRSHVIGRKLPATCGRARLPVRRAESNRRAGSYQAGGAGGNSGRGGGGGGASLPSSTIRVLRSGSGLSVINVSESLSNGRTPGLTA